jgi:hypothetical protein
MSEGLLFLKPCDIVARHTTPCTDFDVNEGKPSGRTIGRIYLGWSVVLVPERPRTITCCGSRLCADTRATKDRFDICNFKWC